jgi:WhiB family transcriptional regulator, redox-sensing transcriptional regulator
VTPETLRPTWHRLAACRDHPLSWWFPEESWSSRAARDATARAKAICATCPVQAPCAEAGASERFGTWGGRSPSERRPRRSKAG